MDMKKCCENCTFGQDSHRSFSSHCHRHAPKTMVTEYGIRAMWPPVQRSDFCGDFEPKNPE